MNTNRLEADSITLNFGLHAVLANIYLKCEQGEIVGLLGRNGTGKSSLMKIIFGTLACESKSVRINGMTLSGNYLKNSTISYLPQQALIPPNISLQKALELYHIPTATIVTEFPELKKLLPLKPPQCSGGELKLAEIILILYSKAAFCLLDEPFSGLAPIMIDRIKTIIQKTKTKKGILVTDHLHHHVTSIADRLYLLTAGQSREITTPDQLIRYGYVTTLY